MSRKPRGHTLTIITRSRHTTFGLHYRAEVMGVDARWPEVDGFAYALDSESAIMSALEACRVATFNRTHPRGDPRPFAFYTGASSLIKESVPCMACRYGHLHGHRCEGGKP